jgi:hypothetical protein
MTLGTALTVNFHDGRDNLAHFAECDRERNRVGVTAKPRFR